MFFFLYPLTNTKKGLNIQVLTKVRSFLQTRTEWKPNFRTFNSRAFPHGLLLLLVDFVSSVANTELWNDSYSVGLLRQGMRLQHKQQDEKLLSKLIVHSKKKKRLIFFLTQPQPFWSVRGIFPAQVCFQLGQNKSSSGHWREVSFPIWIPKKLSPT